MLTWIETDAKLRELTHGAKGMDDFARAFFGMKDGDYGELTYTFEDVASTLNSIAPYDWANFLREHLDGHNAHAPLGGFTASGYTLTYAEEETPYLKGLEKSRKYVNLTYGPGLAIKSDGTIMEVIWDSAAFNAGLAIGMKVVAVNGHAWPGSGGAARDLFKEELTAAKTSKAPIKLLIQSDDMIRQFDLNYTDGMRYPHFVKPGKDEGALDRLLKPLP
jgi:predicted metalloprotease with PDZ domain